MMIKAFLPSTYPYAREWEVSVLKVLIANYRIGKNSAFYIGIKLISG